ncbi:SusE domain-containing protein [Halosquirtibacter xylanolyticus]|uniref:SusE domain-containing protein n=1 Tax=Halosquirtibacter xylanolyticus TaxID=3374599 RepID=UPI00374979AF|nr:SusE domain-containing protein [Prolixibacteraceae bacterium]
MKYSKILLGVMAILFAFTSCENKDDVGTVKPITAPLIQNPDGSASYVLEEADANGSFDTFLWTDAYLGEGLTPTYELQFDLGTGDFSDPKKISDIDKNYYSIKVGDMNQMLRELGTTAGVLSNIQCRVVAKSGEMVQTSTAVSFLVNRYIYQDEIITIGLYGTSVGEQEFLPMVPNVDRTQWSIITPLEVGNFIFKDNSYRQTTYGVDPDNAGMTIENGGNSITTVAKTYRVTFDLTTKAYTIEDYTFPDNLYVVGSWNNWVNKTVAGPGETLPALMRNVKIGNYEAYVYFADKGGFKFITELGSWDTQYADDSNNPANGNLTLGGGDIPVVAGGMILITADLIGMKWTTTQTNWGVIGDATPGGWDTDTDLVVDENTHLLSVTLDLTAGAIKFRANDDWALNYGDADMNGELDQDNDNNITITDAGNYTITVNFNQYPYTYTLVKN